MNNILKNIITYPIAPNMTPLTMPMFLGKNWIEMAMGTA